MINCMYYKNLYITQQINAPLLIYDILFQRLCLTGIAICTFFFTLVWQFAQFILLLESMAFFGTYSLGFISKHKVSLNIIKTNLC